MESCIWVVYKKLMLEFQETLEDAMKKHFINNFNLLEIFINKQQHDQQPCLLTI